MEITTDTPWPPDEPTGPNPPDGAIINFYMKSKAQGPVTLEVFHKSGELVRRYSSDDPVFTPDPALNDFDAKLLALRGEVRAPTGGRGRRGRRGGEGGSGLIPATLVGASAAVSQVMNSLQSADVAPTTAQREALVKPREALSQVMEKWTEIASSDLAVLNAQLRATSLPPLTLDCAR